MGQRKQLGVVTVEIEAALDAEIERFQQQGADDLLGLYEAAESKGAFETMLQAQAF
jgi:hypothetical protein